MQFVVDDLPRRPAHRPPTTSHPGGRLLGVELIREVVVEDWCQGGDELGAGRRRERSEPTTWRAMASPTIWEATRLARSSGRSRPTREARGRSNRWATSSFVALEGILLGSALGLVTAYLLFQNDPSFDNAGRGFPVPWVSIAVLVAATALASLAATAWPSRKASRIRPAVALRIAD